MSKQFEVTFVLQAEDGLSAKSIGSALSLLVNPPTLPPGLAIISQVTKEISDE